MAMGEFGEFGRTHGDNLDIEMEGLASELVVTIEGDFFAFDFLNGEHAHPEVSFGMEAHPDLGRVGAERRKGYQLEEFFAVFPVTKLRGYEDVLGVAGDKAFDALLEPWDDVLGAVKILHRATIAGGVDDVTLVVLQGVFDGDDGFFSYAHGV